MDELVPNLRGDERLAADRDGSDFSEASLIPFPCKYQIVERHYLEPSNHNHNLN